MMALRQISLRFVVKGKAIGLARPRVTRHGTYLPKSSKEYRKRIQAAAREAMGNRPLLEGEMYVHVTEFRKIPKSWPKWKTKIVFQNGIGPTSRPDIDNVVKAVLDACNGVVWRDDAQVTDLAAQKRYGDSEGVVVYIEQSTGDDNG